MLLLRGVFIDERKLISWCPGSINWNLDKRMLDVNTVTLAVHFTNEELSKILQYDRERQRNDEKIIVGVSTFLSNAIVINPTNLSGAVESFLITKLSVLVRGDRHYSFESPALQLIEECAFKHLYIATSTPFILEFSHVEDVIRLINRYKSTLNCLEFCFETVDMTAFSKIYEVVEHWIITTSITVSITACKDTSNKQCTSIPEYNDIQERLQFLIKCKSFLERFQEATEKNKREELCVEIINNNPKFTKNFSKYEPSKIKKVMGDEHIYNTFLGYYIDNSIILQGMSEWCYKDKGEPLPYNVKERIVEHIGGIGVIIEIDNDLKNNNSTTYQQDKVINSATVMNDISLTTSGTIADCVNCCIIT